MRTVWLASYPKSGNTWVRFLLYSLLYGPPSRSIDVSRRIPDVHRPITFTPPDDGPLYAKTHFERTDRHPHLATTERAVCVVRHPRDVLLSALNYRRLTGADEHALPARAYAAAFIRAGGDPDWARQGFGTWASNARSWLSTDRFPVHAVRYEDLKADAGAQLRAIAAFLGLEAPDDAVARAVKASTFDALRALEVREKAAPAKGEQGERLFIGDRQTTRAGVFFINAGKSGQSLDSIAPGLDAQFDAAFAPAMSELGYASS